MSTTALHPVAEHRRSPLPAAAPVTPAEAVSRDRRYRVALVLAVALGIAVRAYHVLSYDFPLNDGGLFFAMVRDLQAAHYHLPAFTSYNQAGIPFAYSPLGFYLAGLLDDWTPLTLVQIFRWLPLLTTALLVVVFADLARTLLQSRTAVIAAVLGFSLVPRSFIWMLMGGGLTRSLGFLFALITIRLLYGFYTSRRWRYVPLIALTAALTVLSHLGTAPFVAFTGVLLLIAYGRSRPAVIGSLAAGVGAGLLSAPWWATVLRQHGLGPFLAANATGGSIFRSLDLTDVVVTLSQLGLGTAESILAVIGMLGALGFFYSLAIGEWLLPAWWITTVTLDARQGSTFSTIPIALLAGIAVGHLLLPAMRRFRVPVLRQSPGQAGWSPEFTLGLLLAFAGISALVRTPIPGGIGDMGALTPDERQAMSWVAQQTTPDARLLVIAGTPWEIDRTSEWLPVLARRKSVATVQGYEWRPIGEFARKKQEYNSLQDCAGWESQCLRDWSRSTGQWFTHVYIPKSPDRECCRSLRYSLEHDRRYREIYDGPGAVMFALRQRGTLAER